MQEDKQKRIRIPRILNIIIDVIEWILFIALLCIAFIMLSPILPTNKYLQTYIVPTGSMEPTIHVGSVAVVQTVDPKTLQKGDIIAFVNPLDAKMIILHRIYSISSPHNVLTIQTKGDHNNGIDPWKVGVGLIKGKMLMTFPYIGYLGQEVKTLTGFILIVIIPGLILLLLQTKRIKTGIEEEVVRRTKKITDNISKPEAMSTLIFLLGISLFFGSGASKYSYASYLSSIKMTNVTFKLASSFPSTGALTPSPTGTTDIDVSGNGAGSTTNVTVNNNNNNTITQTNNTTTTTTIDASVSTSGNSGSANTNSGLTFITGSANTVISLTTQDSSSSANVSH
jgi:signal peptidase I